MAKYRSVISYTFLIEIASAWILADSFEREV